MWKWRKVYFPSECWKGKSLSGNNNNSRTIFQLLKLLLNVQKFIACNQLQNVTIRLHETTNLIARIYFIVLINIITVFSKSLDRLFACNEAVWWFLKVIVKSCQVVSLWIIFLACDARTLEVELLSQWFLSLTNCRLQEELTASNWINDVLWQLKLLNSLIADEKLFADFNRSSDDKHEAAIDESPKEIRRTGMVD